MGNTSSGRERRDSTDADRPQIVRYPPNRRSSRLRKYSVAAKRRNDPDLGDEERRKDDTATTTTKQRPLRLREL
jgi:hypothetical protein